MKSVLRIVVFWMGRAEMAISMVLTLLIVAIMSFQICARYLFDAPVPWMEEVVTILFILLTLFSAAVVTKEKRHIIVDLFPAGRISRILGVIMSAVTVAVLLAILANIGTVLTVEMRRSTISLPVNFPIAFYNTVPLIYCFCSIIITLVNDLLFERLEDKGASV